MLKSVTTMASVLSTVYGYCCIGFETTFKVKVTWNHPTS